MVSVNLFMCALPNFMVDVGTFFPYKHELLLCIQFCILLSSLNISWSKTSMPRTGIPEPFLTTAPYPLSGQTITYISPSCFSGQSRQKVNNMRESWPPERQATLRASQPFLLFASWSFSERRRKSCKLEFQGQNFSSFSVLTD